MGLYTLDLNGLKYSGYGEGMRGHTGTVKGPDYTEMLHEESDSIKLCDDVLRSAI